MLNGKSVKMIAGNKAMMLENAIDIKDVQERAYELAKSGKTPIYFAYDGKLIGAADRRRDIENRWHRPFFTFARATNRTGEALERFLGATSRQRPDLSRRRGRKTRFSCRRIPSLRGNNRSHVGKNGIVALRSDQRNVGAKLHSRK